MSADESCSDHALMDQIMLITRFWIILGVTSKMYLWLASAETTFVVNRDNSTFEIVLQQPLDCPEMFYLYMPSQGEFFRRDDGRDVTEDSRKLCIKCTRCLDGVQVMRKCNQYQDVECGVKCLEPGYRFDEGTRSCQHEKVLDDGFTHDELRKWLAEQSRGRELVSEVGIKKSTHIVTTTSSRRRTTEVTSKRHSHGTLSTSKGNFMLCVLKCDISPAGSYFELKWYSLTLTIESDVEDPKHLTNQDLTGALPTIKDKIVLGE